VPAIAFFHRKTRRLGRAGKIRMMYIAQISAFFAVTWASIYYEWTPNPYVTGVVAFLAALLVTAIIMEIKLLPSRFARLHSRVLGLKDEPRDEVLSLPATTRHPRNSLQDGRGVRIGKDPR
jgi:hypothetical protein